MKKKITVFISIILIIVPVIIFFLIYDFNNKKLNFSKIRNIIPQRYIAFVERKATHFINFEFEITEKKDYFIDNKKIKFERFSNPLLKHRYYLAQDKNKIFAVTKRGELFYFSKGDLLDQQKFKLKKIKTNLQKIIGEKYISELNTVIKGITIIDETVYISYLHNNAGCFSNAILKGVLNKKKIVFSPFFNIDECKNRFVAAVGGNIEKFKNNKILLTIGDHEAYELALENDPQNKNSYYGKILSIDLNTKKIDMLSMGHRNQQGLFYDFKNDIIFMTEHGPAGGDEINININPSNDVIKNYGWAISSYGKHYDGDNLKLLELAPLHKSHSKFGFIEPIKDFTPSIGITQILKVKYSLNNEHKILVGGMGWGERVDDMTLHILNFDKDNLVETAHHKIRIDERIRDMIDLKDGTILMTLETTDSFGLLKNIY